MLRGVLELALWGLLYGVDKLTAPLVAVDRLRRRSAPPPRPHAEESPAAEEMATKIEQETDTNPEEEEGMNTDQDLSGDMVKVVQFTIVSIATDIQDNARVLLRPRPIAFSDDMTAADFSAWVLNMPWVPRSMKTQAWLRYKEDLPDAPEDSEYAFLDGGSSRDDEILLFKRHKEKFHTSEYYKLLSSPKYHRVAFHVMGRFAAADFNWHQVQAKYLSKIADRLEPCPPQPRGNDE